MKARLGHHMHNMFVISLFYWPQSKADNTFGSVRPSICQSFCAFMLELFDLWPWFLARGSPWPWLGWDCRSRSWVKGQCQTVIKHVFMTGAPNDWPPKLPYIFTWYKVKVKFWVQGQSSRSRSYIWCGVVDSRNSALSSTAKKTNF